MKKIHLFVCLLLAIRLSGQTDTPAGPKRLMFFAGAEYNLLGAGSGSSDPSAPWIDFQQEAAGLTLGALMRFPLYETLFFQPELAFSYAAHHAVLWADNRPAERIRYVFSEIELPVHLVFSKPFGNMPMRSSILFGGRLGLNVASGQPQSGVALSRERLGIDLGLGLEFGWGKWRLQPEFLYSHGMNDLHADTGRLYDRTVNRILRDKMCLRLVIGKRGKN
ncbi:MAG TPA: hypothetical protein PKL15_00660 [Saprospiraceae bacterium]|nr:hypothetical protein [Saprospiraceae bacterium]